MPCVTWVQAVFPVAQGRSPLPAWSVAACSFAQWVQHGLWPLLWVTCPGHFLRRPRRSVSPGFSLGLMRFPREGVVFPAYRALLASRIMGAKRRKQSDLHVQRELLLFSESPCCPAGLLPAATLPQARASLSLSRAQSSCWCGPQPLLLGSHTPEAFSTDGF